jgi:hypothetical protein
MEGLVKPRTISMAAIALAGGLLLGNSQIAGVRADDRHDRACSNKTLKGSYGFYRTGTTPTGPLASVGIIFFDGKGNAFASQSISRNGVFTFDVAFPNTYEVAEDCTGKEFLDTGVEFARIVIVDGEKGFTFSARRRVIRSMESERKSPHTNTTTTAELELGSANAVIGHFRSRINDGRPSFHDALVEFQAFSVEMADLVIVDKKKELFL